MQQQIKFITFGWRTSNGGEFLQKDFPIHPAFHSSSDEEFVKAFSDGFDLFQAHSRDEIKTYVKSWKKTDHTISAAPYVSYFNKDIEGKVQEYIDNLKIKI